MDVGEPRDATPKIARFSKISLSERNTEALPMTYFSATVNHLSSLNYDGNFAITTNRMGERPHKKTKPGSCWHQDRVSGVEIL